jgi:hypothetical protein
VVAAEEHQHLVAPLVEQAEAVVVQVDSFTLLLKFCLLVL